MSVVRVLALTVLFAGCLLVRPVDGEPGDTGAVDASDPPEEDGGDDDSDEADTGEASGADPGAIVDVPAGFFTLGCEVGRDDGHGGCGDDETPTKAITLTRALKVMASEVSQVEFTRLMGTNPSHHGPAGGGDRCVAGSCPVERVSWFDAVAFANAKSTEDLLPACYELTGCSGAFGVDYACTGVDVTAEGGEPYACTGWRLPTEAEWEFIARAGLEAAFAGGDALDDVAWHLDNAGNTTHTACTRRATPNGLCDFTGNVREWVWDRYTFAAYSLMDFEDPFGHDQGEDRAVRGGGYLDAANASRVANRDSVNPYDRMKDLGFRLVRTAP